MSAARFSLGLGALFGLTAIILNAVATHALNANLPEQARGWIDLATRYQLIHGVVLVVLSSESLLARSRFVAIAAGCFSLGILIFSGSLYSIALHPLPLLNQITPMGGLLLMAGWLCLFLAAIFQTKNQKP